RRPAVRRGEEHLRGRTVRVLLEKVMLDRPDVVEAELVGELHLLEGVVVHGALGLARPRARDRELVEEAELHAYRPRASSSAASFATDVPSKKRGFCVPHRWTELANVKSRKLSSVITPSSTSSYAS